MKNIHDGHRARMRERYKDCGLYGFRDHEVLELLLFAAIPRGNTNDIAHRLLNTFGSVENVLKAPYGELTAVDGVGDAAATVITLIAPIAKKYLSVKVADERFNSSYECGVKMVEYFKNIDKEQVVLIYLTDDRRVVDIECISDGDFKSADFSVKKLAERLIASGANSFIMSHNHPSGIALPSVRDLETTVSVKVCAEGLGIRMLDHIIVAGDDFVSLVETDKYRHIFYDDIYEKLSF